MSDVWRAIAGFPGYFVSDLGKVMSLRDKHGGTDGAARLLRPDQRERGDMRVTLTGQDGRLRRKWVHRLVIESFRGPCPPGKSQVDHINRDPSDNRVSNLRWVSASENNRNRPHVGVFFEKGRWKARIRVGSGKRIRLGGFETREEALEAYREARIDYHGMVPCES